ncbi:MAG: hypothetical protein ACK4K3_07480 [Aquabacterium sp.]
MCSSPKIPKVEQQVVTPIEPVKALSIPVAPRAPSGINALRVTAKK